jgi:hypothetical protein
MSKDTISLIITIPSTIIAVGYLEQQNVIPQENYFTSIVALIVVFTLIGTLVNMIIGNTEDKKDTVFASTPEKETAISGIVLLLAIIIAIVVIFF